MSTYILRKGIATLGDLVDGDLATKFPGSEVIRVAQSYNGQVGSDGNDGSSWEEAFLTLQAAINYARYSKGTGAIDYSDKTRSKVVAVWPGHYNEGEILWSGYNINVIGVGVEVPGKDYGVSINYDGAADATAAFAFSGSGNSVQNLHVYCDFAAPAIYCAAGDNNLIRNCVIEGDGTNATYGIQMSSMKGSRVEGCIVNGVVTAGIYVAGGADHYFINGWIRDCHVYMPGANKTGILVDSTNVAYNSVIDRNFVSCASGATSKGIDVNTTGGGPLVADNYVSVPSSATPIEHAGGDQFLLGNHTAAGTTNTDPNPAAG